jgi:integrase
MGNVGDDPLTWMEGGIPEKVPTQQPRKRRIKAPTLSKVRDEFVNYTQESFEYEKYIKCRKALDEFIDLVGDIEPSKIDRRMAAQFISAYFKLHPKAAKATMGNKMGSLSTFHRWAWKKGLMEELNPFKDYKIEPNEGVQTKSFEPFSQEDLVHIFNQDWESHSPHARLLLALLTITGCRLNEIASLSWRRIIQDNEMTYITLIPEATATDVFRVKEKQGEESQSSARREIPLHKELILPKRPADPDAPLFPFTRSRLTGKANSLAELAINHQFKNPSIRRLFPNEPLKRVHSFRSSLARMLTEVNTPIDIKGWITGHKIKNALSDTYDGASRTKKLNYLNQIDFSKINLNG